MLFFDNVNNWFSEDGRRLCIKAYVIISLGQLMAVTSNALVSTMHATSTGIIFYSLVLQAVCDHEMRFTDVFVGWPGSAHETTVFDDSDLGRLSATYPSTLFRDGTHQLGDKAYCLTPTLLIPYKEGRDLDN